MISRRTVLLLAEIYTQSFFYTFSSGFTNSPRKSYSIDGDKLYDYLYTNDYDPWFCNAGRAASKGYSEKFSRGTRNLKDFIMQLHTGETQAKVTVEWSWEQRKQLGQRYLKDLAEDILNTWTKEWSKKTYGKPKIDDKVTMLLDNLQLDGYVYQNSHLLAPETDVLDAEEEGGVLRSLYNNLQLDNNETAFHHLKLSEEHYLNKKWDDSISNSRKFLECTLKEVANSHSTKMHNKPLPQSTLTRPVRIRDYLEREGLLEKKEKEVIASVYGLLSQTGGHPYMAQNDQARLLRHLSLTFSQFAMLRYRGVLNAQT